MRSEDVLLLIPLENIHETVPIICGNNFQLCKLLHALKEIFPSARQNTRRQGQTEPGAGNVSGLVWVEKKPERHFGRQPAVQ